MDHESIRLIVCDINSRLWWGYIHNLSVFFGSYERFSFNFSLVLFTLLHRDVLSQGRSTLNLCYLGHFRHLWIQAGETCSKAWLCFIDKTCVIKRAHLSECYWLLRLQSTHEIFVLELCRRKSLRAMRCVYANCWYVIHIWMIRLHHWRKTCLLCYLLGLIQKLGANITVWNLSIGLVLFPVAWIVFFMSFLCNRIYVRLRSKLGLF